MSKALKEENLFDIKKECPIITLCGNPNTGKSSIFNALTKLNQHTGNWPGKTISNARGYFSYEDNKYMLVDVPGTYSLLGMSEEEIVARDFICFGKSDLLIVVCDATNMERSLNLFFQAKEYHENIIVVVNLIDEAKKKGVKINNLKLEYYLGVPVIFTSAKTMQGFDKLKEAIKNFEKYPKNEILLADDLNLEEIKMKLPESPFKKSTLALRILEDNESFFTSLYKYTDLNKILINELRVKYKRPEIREKFITENFQKIDEIIKKTIIFDDNKLKKDIFIDNIVTSKLFGIPLMILLLSFVLYLTLIFANYPSQMLFKFFSFLEGEGEKALSYLALPTFLKDMLVKGIFRNLSWVVAVMLPPMVIFFPLFTFFEDLGYLPRIAYNLDYSFKKCHAHGKQSLTMCMGFGCNACGVIGSRIIDSKRERFIAIITNSLIPCNGRFPTLLLISGLILSNIFLIKSNWAVIGVITCLIIFAVLMTFLASFILAKTFLKGESSTFTLEMPPYRLPNIKRILYTSIIDRTIFVLKRAASVAIIAGLVIFLLCNLNVNEQSLITYLINSFEGFGIFLGLDGIIIVAFILGFPANEVILAIIFMLYLGKGEILEIDSRQIFNVLENNGWTLLTYLNFLFLFLFHHPCSTTLLTIKKETKSNFCVLLSACIPLIIGICLCLVNKLIFHWFL